MRTQMADTLVLKSVKQILVDLEGDRDKYTIIIRDLNTPLSIFDRTSRQEIS